MTHLLNTMVALRCSNKKLFNNAEEFDEFVQ